MNVRRQLWIFCLLLVGGFLVGCSNSDELRKEAETLQGTVTTLRAENDSLQRLTSKLAVDIRTASAHITDLEAQVTDLKQKLAAATPPAPPPKPHMTDPHAAYMHGLEQFRARNYADAEETFQSIINGEGPAELQNNCTYWLGECAYGEKKFADAIGHFQKVLTFPISKKKDDAQIMIANSYFATGNKAKAKEAYERLVKVFPASPYIKVAKAKLEKL